MPIKHSYHKQTAYDFCFGNSTRTSFFFCNSDVTVEGGLPSKSPGKRYTANQFRVPTSKILKKAVLVRATVRFYESEEKKVGLIGMSFIAL